MEVVLRCDRCEDVVPMELEALVGGVGGLSARARAKLAAYATVSIGSMTSQTKNLTLCPECVRGFRLFMLGAGPSSVRVAETWESIVCGAV